MMAENQISLHANHPFIHFDIHVENFYQVCLACAKPLAGFVCFCVRCKMMLHKSCIELPHQIEHPLRSLHPLTLSNSVNDGRGAVFSCKACMNNSRGFAYMCDPCQFYLDTNCACPLLYPLVKSELHKHPLAFSDFKPEYRYFDCDKCSGACVYPSFRCVDCYFNLHPHCLSELPPTVN